MQDLLWDIQKQHNEMSSQEKQAALAQAAAALRANGQEVAARLILQDPQPHGMPTTLRSGLPQRNVGHPQMPVVSPLGLPIQPGPGH